MPEPAPIAATARRRVWLINQWLPPDPAPTAVLCGELISVLQAEGYELVLVSRVRGDDVVPADGNRRICIDRLASGPTRISAKLASWPRFAWRTWRLLRAELKSGDLVIVCSDPPLFYPLAIAAAKRAGARVVHWSQDVYPDVVQRYWPSLAVKWLLAPLRAWRNRKLRQADRVVAISPGMSALMQAAGARTTVLPNWARDDRLTPRPLGRSDLRNANYHVDDFVLAYSGNLGRVHEFDTLLAAARLLRDEPRIQFLVVGSGPRLAELRAAVESDDLRAFRFLPLQPEALLADTLAAGDMHFVSLRPEFEGLVLPSKVYSICAVGRGVLFCGDAEGETATLVREYRCGLATSMSDAAALATAIRQLAADPERCATLGRNARQMIDSASSRAMALTGWRALIAEMARR